MITLIAMIALAICRYASIATISAKRWSKR